MSGYQDSDHYDVQFSTRQLALLLGVLVVIVGASATSKQKYNKRK